jgi:probable HAF family extracellular repeat protein
VVGRFFTQQGDRAFVYDRGEVRDLGTLGGHISAARGINRFGQIVGYSLTGASDNFGFINAAFISDGFLMQNLNLDWSAASAINDAGQIVGEMRFTPGVDLLHAFLYEQGAATDLGSLPPLADSAYSSAHSINEAGQVVGQSNTYVLGKAFPSRRYFAVRAFVYDHGAMRDLGSLGVVCSEYSDDGLVEEECVENSVATDINNSGTIVGFSSTPTTVREHAFLSNRQGLQDLGTLGGDGSWAYGVNDSVQIVGFSSAGDTFGGPFLYERGTMYDLNDLIVNPSVVMPFVAFDINNFGQIVGNHHVLHPLYEQVAPGRALAFTSVLSQTFGFAYWVSRGNGVACHASTSRLRLQVRFQVPDERKGPWIPADVVNVCGDSTDWQPVSVAIPSDLQGKNGVVQIRVREAGPRTDPSVYLRHFSME